MEKNRRENAHLIERNHRARELARAERIRAIEREERAALRAVLRARSVASVEEYERVERGRRRVAELAGVPYQPLPYPPNAVASALMDLEDDDGDADPASAAAAAAASAAASAAAAAAAAASEPPLAGLAVLRARVLQPLEAQPRIEPFAEWDATRREMVAAVAGLSYAAYFDSALADALGLVRIL
jgi:hypothetical protein